MKITRLALLPLMTGLLCSQMATAGTLSLGAGALVSPDPYRSNQDRVTPVPVINYEGENFFFRSLMAGYYLWKDDTHQLSLNAFYSPLHFSPGDSDNDEMKHLSKRRSTVMAGLGYTYNAQWGSIRTLFSGDVLDNSNGLVGDVAYLYRFRQDNWSLTPGVGVTWNSKNQNNYYYGIDNAEARRSGLDSYHPDDSFAPYAELSANYQFAPQWNAFAMARYVRLADEVKNSPMVDKSWTGVLWAGATYTF